MLTRLQKNQTMKKNKNLVYSTDPIVNQQIKIDSKRSNQADTLSTYEDGIVRIHKETKGRGGKGVSIIKGLNLPEDELKKLAKKLKQHCSTGGTIKDGTIEIQGTQRDTIKLFLEKQGYQVKLAGG